MNFRIQFFGFLLLILCSSALAQEPVPIEFTIVPTAKPIYEKIHLEDEIEGIFGLLTQYKPSSNNLFQWNASTPHNPSISHVTFTLTTSDDSEVRKHVSESPFPSEESLQKSGLTILWSKKNPKTNLADESKQSIEVFLFLDRIFFDKSGERRNDGVTRMLGILAHEIFGNVNRFLQVNPERSYKSNLVRINAEIDAFQAGIDFLHRIIADLEKDEKNKNFVMGLKINLQEQIEMQDQWHEILNIESSIQQNQNRFTIQQGSDVELMKVYKISGEEVNLEKIYNVNTKVLDLNLLPVGTYLVHIKATNPDQEIIKRIVILTPGKGIKGLTVNGSYANFWVTLNGIDTEIPRINRMLDKAKAEIKAVFSENECVVRNLSAEVYGYQSNDAYKYHIFINWDATCNKMDKMEISIKMPSWKWNSAYVRIQPYLKGQPKTFIEKEIE